jgi:hypothetical protein
MANQYIRFPDVNTEASNVFVTNTSSSPVPVTIDGTITAATVKIEDSFGNPLASTSEALNTYLTNTTLAVTQSTTPWVVSGTITANAGTGTFAVSAASLPLPSGAATSANQTNGTQITQVSNFPATQPVSGTVTALQGTSPWVVSGTVTTSPNVNVHDGSGNSISSTTGALNVDVTNFPSLQSVSLMQAGGSSNTIKAASTAAVATDTSLVVALNPNTQTPRLADSAGSGTITAAGQSVTANTNGASTVLFSLTGTWSANLITEIQAGDGNWIGINCYQLNSNAAPTVLLTVNGVYAVPCGGGTQVRITPFTFTSGMVSITYNTGAGTNLDYMHVSQGQAPWAVSGPNSYRNLTTATTTVVKNATGRLYGVAVNTLVSGATLTLYDNTAGSGTIIATQTLVFTTSAATSYTWSPTLQNIGGVTFATGLTAVTTGTANWTIYYT